jgi:hypothetical protein
MNLCSGIQVLIPILLQPLRLDEIYLSSAAIYIPMLFYVGKTIGIEK